MPAPAGVFLERHSARTKQLVIELAINTGMTVQGMDKQAVFALQAQRREERGGYRISGANIGRAP